MAINKVDKEKERALKKLGDHIVKLRMSKNITSAEFARRCDMERSNIARIEMGRSNTTFYNLLRIAKALDISISELLKDFDER
jgi:transcriptional regulator with XRE-family HTH domain